MRSVLQCGVNVDPPGPGYWNRTPLYDVRSADAVMLLLEFGADVKKQDNHGVTPLHYVVLKGSTDAVRLLTEHWPDGVMAADCLVDTPLHVAAEAGKLDAIRVMVEHCPAAIRAKNRDGDTLYEYAARHGRSAVLSLLEILGGAKIVD
jgi:ankyrin repeat protein